MSRSIPWLWKRLPIEKLIEFLRIPAEQQHASAWFEETFNARTQAELVGNLLDELLSKGPSVDSFYENRLIAAKKTAKAWLDALRTPPRARLAQWRDRKGVPAFDPGPERAIEEGVAWLCRAQDHSASRDGGVARDFSLIDGWSSSYPETTGYIADTFIVHGGETRNRHLVKRAFNMLDWLVSIQLADGAFQGGTVGLTPLLPGTFDTGQVLIGLTAGTHIDERYRRPMIRAADWLLNAQDTDGCWRRYETPFAAPGEKVYETHAAIGLFRAAVLEPGRGYAEAAIAQVRWALGRQTANGWFHNCCLTDPERPLTHTLGYALRGVVEAYLWTRDKEFLQAACRTADALLRAFGADGRLAGRLTSQWRPAADWVCLSGTSQIAESLLLLFDATQSGDFRNVARAANAFVRRTLSTAGPLEIRGGVKGSFPVDGWYGRWQYLNWACKFMIDANRAELRVGR
jgi:hypothetical protein